MNSEMAYCVHNCEDHIRSSIYASFHISFHRFLPSITLSNCKQILSTGMAVRFCQARKAKQSNNIIV